MTNKKIWAATLFSTLLLTMTISSPVKAAELQTSTTVDRSQITLPLSEETEENLFSLESVSDIQMSELVDPDEVISVSDGDDTIQARKGTATKYGWSYGTTPYTFTQKWSTDTEVYSTYPYYNDGLLYPAATELLDAPSNSQYSSAVREGYVNDTWATEQSIVGAHVYYHKVSSNKALNSVTVLLDKNVAFQIYDAELNPVLDTSSTAQVRTISLSGTGMSKIKRWRLMAPNKSVWVANESDFYPSINFNFVNDSSSNAKLKGTWSVAFQSSSSSYTFIPSYSVSYYYEYGD